MRKPAALSLAVACGSTIASAGTVEFSKGTFDVNSPGVVELDLTLYGDRLFDTLDMVIISDDVPLIDWTWSSGAELVLLPRYGSTHPTWVDGGYEHARSVSLFLSERAVLS